MLVVVRGDLVDNTDEVVVLNDNELNDIHLDDILDNTRSHGSIT